MRELDEESKKLWKEFWSYEVASNSLSRHNCSVLLECNIRGRIEYFTVTSLPDWYHINFCCECGKLLEPLTQEEKDYEKSKGLIHSCCNQTKNMKLKWIRVKRENTGDEYAFSLKFCFHCGSILDKRTNYE